MLDNPQKTGAASTRKSPRLNLREHLADLEVEGLLVRVDRPINKDTELHPLFRWQFIGGTPTNDRRAFLFTNVTDSKGRKYDMPVVVGALASSPRIYALGLGTTVEQIGDTWLHAINNPIPPERVKSARCQEVVIKGDDLRKPGGGIATLPVPISTPGFDAAPYLAATLCVTRDPETGVQNMGMYRAALKATDRLAVRMSAQTGGAGGYIHWCKQRDAGKPLEIAIVLGAAPIICFNSAQKLPIDLDELAVAGGLAGKPISVVKCLSVDLDVPADAEIVVEGIIDTSKLEPEAPFGESNGYVALEAFNMPMKITAITHKRDAIFNSILSQMTPSESSGIKIVAYEPLYLDHLRNHLSIKHVKRVVMHEPLTNLRPVIFVQLEKGAPHTEIWRALHGTANYTAGVGKIVFAITEDIDPLNTDAVMWSLAYRCNPINDIHITPYRRGPQGAHYKGREADSTMLIDATQKSDMPPISLPGKEYMEGARRIWDELNLPPLTVKAPWHGYSLGKWNDAYEAIARRAVAGDWEINGQETLARQRSGLTPETPAWSVEGEGVFKK